MANGKSPVISCTSDAAALATLPRRRPDVDIVQRGPGGPVSLEAIGRAPEAWFPQQLAPRSGTEVIPYVYGKCFLFDVAAALETATSEDHRIYLLGWDGEKGTELTPGKTLESYLKGTHAQVRAMFWDGIVARVSSMLLIEQKSRSSPWFFQFLNGLSHGACVMDDKHAHPATHHQKILVVQGSKGLIAFIGGMDLMPNRATIVGTDEGTPWHDIQVRVRGPAAMECRDVFKERWLDNPQTFPLDRKLGVPNREAFPAPEATQPVPTATIPPGGRTPPARWVRIARTYPNMRKWGGGRDFGFATQGHYGAWSLVEHAIRSARRFIYLEDQYLVSRMARQLLLQKLQEKDFRFLLMLMNGKGALDEENYVFAISERNRFRKDLRAIDPRQSKWGLYTLKRAPDPDRRKWCGTYMHSKTWVFDDELAIVGSANCENRGYTLNTEAVAAITDDARVNATGIGFARHLRIALWHKHLGLPHDQLQDWTSGLSQWARALPTAMVQNASAPEPDKWLGDKQFPDAGETPHVERLWTTLCDPDGR